MVDTKKRSKDPANSLQQRMTLPIGIAFEPDTPKPTRRPQKVTRAGKAEQVNKT